MSPHKLIWQDLFKRERGCCAVTVGHYSDLFEVNWVEEDITATSVSVKGTHDFPRFMVYQVNFCQTMCPSIPLKSSELCQEL